MKKEKKRNNFYDSINLKLIFLNVTFPVRCFDHYHNISCAHN